MYECILAMQEKQERTPEQRSAKSELLDKIDDAILEYEPETLRIIADLLEVIEKGPRSPLDYALLQVAKKLPKRKAVSISFLALEASIFLNHTPSTSRVATSAKRLGIKTLEVRGKSFRRALKK